MRQRIGWPIAARDSLVRMAAKQAFRAGALGDSTDEGAGVVDAVYRGRRRTGSRGAADVPRGGPLPSGLDLTCETLVDRADGFELPPRKNDFEEHPGFVLRGIDELRVAFRPTL